MKIEEKFDGQDCGGGLYQARQRRAELHRCHWSASSSSSAQTSQNYQVATSGSGVAIGAGSTVASGGGTALSISGQNNSSVINVAGDVAADQNYGLAFSTISQLASAENAAAQSALSTTNGLASGSQPTIIYQPAAAATSSGWSLSPGMTIGIAAVAAVALILILKNRG